MAFGLASGFGFISASRASASLNPRVRSFKQKSSYSQRRFETVAAYDIDFANVRRKQIYSLLNGLVAPRPIAWITSMNELHAIDRMNGLGSYVKTRDAFFRIPRVPYAEWQKKNGRGKGR